MGKTLSRSRALTSACRAGFTARPSGLPGRQPWPHLVEVLADRWAPFRCPV